MAEETRKYLRVHPIQLSSLNVLELFIRVNELVENEMDIKKGEVSILHGHSEYDPENHTVQVGLKLEVGMTDEPKTPFSMKVDLTGNFKVDEERFDLKNVDDWAKRNAHVILYPYLREHAYALAVRCGLPPVILPLIEVPHFTVEGTKKLSPEDQNSNHI